MQMNHFGVPSIMDLVSIYFTVIEIFSVLRNIGSYNTDHLESSYELILILKMRIYP